MPTFIVDFSNDSGVYALKEHMGPVFLENRSIFA